jgi:hypothetical protein
MFYDARDAYKCIGVWFDSIQLEIPEPLVREVIPV